MIKEHFETTSGYRKWSFIFIGVGILSLILGFVFLNPFGGAHAESGKEAAHNFGETKFWAVLMHNSIYFLLITLASMFFVSVTTMAMGGWQIAFRRVPEAISGFIKIGGVIVILVLLGYVWLSHDHNIYHWKDTEHVKHDKILNWKSGFLNKNFFTIATLVVITLWILFRNLYRKNSLAEDLAERGTTKYFWKSIVFAAAFVVVFTLSVGSTTPWLWLMSIDAHWYSTMYSWYTFSSSWVAGMSLIMLFVIYLKNQGYLEYVTKEHIHDIGKFMFAFSVFWTYLWFDQYMLIWYSNQPEETSYFIQRLGKNAVGGEWRFIALFNLALNFLVPFLVLMRRGSKRNYSVVVFMAIVIIFGHWLDFYQMIMPGPLKDLGNHANTFGLFIFDLGVAIGFVGLLMLVVGKYLAKAPLLPKNHPFVKESIIHHT